MHPEGLGLIGRRKHNPAPDGDRLAAQRRLEQLLDRCVESIEIRMKDGGCGCHLNPFIPDLTKTARPWTL